MRQTATRDLAYRKKDLHKEAKVTFGNGDQSTMKTGSVAIAAITSCTNTSNPYVMLSAGLLAKKSGGTRS